MNKGVYLLFTRLEDAKKIKVGSLGEYEFPPGLYCYVGSAMNGLEQRVGRHLSDEKKKHWHIDYFLDEADTVACLKLRTEEDLECELNRHVSKLGKEAPVGGFGSSDCNCESHFHLLDVTDRQNFGK